MMQLTPPENDGLFVPKVKPWSSQKHYYLARYIDIFTNGMKNQRWTPNLHYVDLFANAGLEDVEDVGLQWGSPLIAAQSTPRFARLHLCELHRDRCQALQTRLSRFPQPSAPQIICGDANMIVGEIAKAIPVRGTLSLAFLDPYGLHLQFDTLRTLCDGERRIDLLIYFPDRVDALRNFGIYLDNPESNLDAVLGGAPWRDILENVARHRWAEELQRRYVEKIKTLGYQSFSSVRIPRTGAPLYQLIFCSKHERGGEFWQKIAQTNPDGQRSLF